MKLSKTSSPVENFTIAYDKTGAGCTLREEWDTTPRYHRHCGEVTKQDV